MSLEEGEVMQNLLKREHSFSQIARILKHSYR